MAKVKSKGVEMRMHRVHPWDSNWKALVTAEVDAVEDSLEWAVDVVDKIRASPKTSRPNP